MIKKALAVAIASAGLAVAPSAQAGEFLQILGPTGVYGNVDVGCLSPAPCAFTNLFNFTTPTGYNRVSVDITSVSASAQTNIDFSPGSVTLNGVPLTFSSFGGIDENGFLHNLALAPGALNVLSVSGLSGGSASYAGTLAFVASVVPEPGTWMLMVAGIGAIGLVLRRRRDSAAPQPQPI